MINSCRPTCSNSKRVRRHIHRGIDVHAQPIRPGRLDLHIFQLILLIVDTHFASCLFLLFLHVEEMSSRQKAVRAGPARSVEEE